MDQTHQPPPPTAQGRSVRVLSEWKTLAALGGPILVAQLAQTANATIDTIMAGHYSAEDLAAVGIGSSLWIPLLLFFFGVLSALQPTISGQLGAGQLNRVMPTTWQGLYVAAVSAVLMILLLTNLEPVLHLLRLEASTAHIVQGYLRAFSWGVPALLLLAGLRGLTDGLGHTRVIMVFSLFGALLNLPLNYIFIYGKLGLPAMGGVGCGWATALSNSIAALGLLVYLYLSRHYQRFHLLAHWSPPRWRDIAALLRLGLPIGATIFVEVSMFAVIALFLAPLGAQVVAAHQIVLNVVSLFFMLPLSLGMALTLRVSFLLGSGAPATAHLVARTSLLLGLGIATAYVPLILWGRELITTLYTNEPGVQTIAAHLLIFAAIFQLADILQVTAISALRGYRDTRVPLGIMLLSFWGICLPLGYVLTFTDWLVPAMGASGFWLALIVGLTCACLLLTLRLWRFQRVPQPV
jgi:multidrug resistance protein, MATE family